MGPFRMPRDLAFPPWRQVAVEILEHVRGLAVQRACLGFDVHVLALPGHCPKLLGLAFDFGQWLFEVEVVGHRSLQQSRPRYMAGGGRICNRRRTVPRCQAVLGQRTGMSVTSNRIAMTQLKVRSLAGLFRTRRICWPRTVQLVVLATDTQT